MFTLNRVQSPEILERALEVLILFTNKLPEAREQLQLREEYLRRFYAHLPKNDPKYQRARELFRALLTLLVDKSE